MMTSRAEFRLLLRQDNADMRLTPIGYKVGLISEERYQRLLDKKKMIEDEMARVRKIIFGANERVQNFLLKNNSTELKKGVTFKDLVCRPELNYDLVSSLDDTAPELPLEVREQVNIGLKYEGYIERESKQVEEFHRIEDKKIPENLDYELVPSLRIEARQKLSTHRPETVGQASRISGVSPSDISVLLVYLKSGKYLDH